MKILKFNFVKKLPIIYIIYYHEYFYAWPNDKLLIIHFQSKNSNFDLGKKKKLIVINLLLSKKNISCPKIILKLQLTIKILDLSITKITLSSHILMRHIIHYFKFDFIHVRYYL